MDKLEIENCLAEIVGNCDFLDYKNPLTYLIFLDRSTKASSPPTWA